MKIEEDKIVMPGDKLGIIEQYLPGEGTYDDDGDIKSSDGVFASTSLLPGVLKLIKK